MPTTEPIILTEKEAKDRGERITQLIESDIRARWPALKELEAVRALYFGSQERMLEYPGQSDIHLYVLADKVEALVPKLMMGFWGAEPIVHVEPMPGSRAMIEEARDAEGFINWAIDNDMDNLHTVTEQWFRNVPLDGVSTVKIYYNEQWRHTATSEILKQLWYPGEIDLTNTPVETQRQKIPEELLLEIFGDNPPFNSILAHDELPPLDIELEGDGPPHELYGRQFVITIIEDRRIYDNVLVQFLPADRIDEVRVRIEREILVYERPEVELVEFEDFIMPYRAEDPQTSERLAHQYWLTHSELRARAEDKRWSITEAEVEELIAKTSDGKQEEHSENNNLKEQKDKHTGVQTAGSASPRAGRDPKLPDPFASDRVLMFEVYCRDNVGGRIDSEVIYDIPYGLRKIVRATYLDERFPHGRRPFASLHNIRISDRFYSTSWGKMLAPINVEVNAIINMVNEAQELINHPFFFYVPHANTVNPEIINGIAPGQGIPISEPGAISFPKFPQEPLANLSTLDSMLLFADRVTMSPQAAGSSQVRNAPRTARGTLALLGESSIKTDLLLQSFQRSGWREMIHQVTGLYGHFGPEEKNYAVTGNAPRRMSSKALRGRFTFKFKGNSTNTNKEIMRVISEKRYMTLINDPAYAQDLQARQNLQRDFLHHHAEGANIELLVAKIPGQGGSSEHPPMSQADELRLIQQGVPVSVLPIDNHPQHMRDIMAFQNGKEFQSWLPHQVTLLAVHAAEHGRHMQAQAAQGATQAGGSTANNLPTGDIGFGDLEGGPQ